MKSAKFIYSIVFLLPVFGFSLTLEEGVKSLLTSNPKFKESVETFNSVRQEYNVAENGYRPTLDLVSSYGHESLKSPSSGNRKISSMRDETSLVLTQNIFNGFGTQSAIKQQKGRLDAAGFSVAERADRITLQFTNAYLSLIKQKELWVLAEENVKTHEAIFKQIKERSDAGFGRLSETQQAGSRFTLAKSNLVSQKNNYKDAVSTFEKFYGKSVDSDELTKPVFMVALPDSFEKIKKNSFTCNPTVKIQEANIRFSEASHEASQAAFYPKIDFEVAGTVANDLSGVDGKEESASALLRLRYNLYNKGADLLNKEKHAILILKEKELMASVERDLMESVRFSWESYENTKERINFLNEHKNYSKETLDAYQQEFMIGRRDLLNLLDAEGEYYSARQALVEAEMMLIYAKYRLLDNMGVLANYFEPDFAQQYNVQTCSSKEMAVLFGNEAEKKSDLLGNELNKVASKDLPKSIETLENTALESTKTEQKIQQCFQVMTKTLNIRTFPDAKSAKIGQYSQGKELCGDAIEDGWLKVENGWVSGEYLKKRP